MIAHLRAAGVSVVVDVAGPALPRVLHWGRDLGELDAAGLAALADVTVQSVPPSSPDRAPELPLLPTEHDAWSGTPGLSGHRSGADAVPGLTLERPATVDGTGLTATASGGGVQVTLRLALDAFGVLSVDGSLTNTGAGTYDVAGLLPLLPLPDTATEVLDLTGHWCRERAPQRSALQFGTHLRAGRRGRPGHDSPLLLTAGSAGFGFRHGEVWATHCAWSGDATHLVERLPEGAGRACAVLGSGELLRPGEVRLAEGATYTAPTSLFVWSGDGLDGLSQRMHRRLRARPAHPSSPRPVVLNTWEAVYFDHDLATLRRLADVAAGIGVERFVIDDGWFGTRRDDTRGLGDWYVADAVWPDGLAPIAEHVRGLGMQVGLWFEPEMANPDSDVVRAHPDWVLTPDAPSWRHQVVLDVANPDVAAHLLSRLDDLVTDVGIDFVKWDHNRDLHAPVRGVRAQTLAVYRLLDDLRARHPRLEIESCASGGARVDLGILERTDRVWTSDCNDALERQHIQRWTGLLLPPELMGAHVGPHRAHTTHRELDLGFRMATALFGHAGLEWDVAACSPEELAAIGRWTAYYKRHRGLLHSGDVVRADLADDGALLHGVLAADRGSALFCWARLATSPSGRPDLLRLPGLDPSRTYRVRVPSELPSPAAVEHAGAPWLPGPVAVPGAVLGSVGLAVPNLGPGQALVLELTSSLR